MKPRGLDPATTKYTVRELDVADRLAESRAERHDRRAGDSDSRDGIATSLRRTGASTVPKSIFEFVEATFARAAHLTGMLVLLAARVRFAPGKDINVNDFGAVGDGKTLDPPRIQNAIDAATASGGGNVTVPKGSYLTGTILLKDNVTLHLEDESNILGTTDLAQYKNLDPFKDGLGAEVGYAFVAVIDAKNVAIEGKGTLNGNGKAVADAKGFKGEGWGFRPMLLRLVRC